MSNLTLGIVDTTFAVVNLAEFAIDEIKNNFTDVKIIYITVPGMKDLPVECKKLLDSGCDICMALAVPGKEKKDAVCAHEASQGLIMAQLLTNKHIIEVFIHEDEAEDEKSLLKICENRTRKHAINAINLIINPESLRKNAGMGIRQGGMNKGPII